MDFLGFFLRRRWHPVYEFVFLSRFAFLSILLVLDRLFIIWFYYLCNILRSWLFKGKSSSISSSDLVCLSLKVNNDHLNFPPRSDHGSITHHRPLCTINSCTDLVSVRMHLDKLRHSHLAPSHTKPIHSMQLVLIILCGDVSSNPRPVHPCGVCN